MLPHSQAPDRAHAHLEVQVLFKFLRHNASFINFWLESCVFEREAKYFPESLRQTAWHLAANAQVRGPPPNRVTCTP